MANDGLITSFLGQGLAAARNAAPTIHPDAIAFWYSTDTNELSAWAEGAWIENILAGGGGGGSLADGDYGDIVVSGSGTVLTIDTAVVSLAKMANMATASLIYRKTAGAGVPEVNTLATLKTDLGLTGTNSGDQTSVTGNAGTATALQTARNINGIAFDGTGNITINAVDATARVPATRLVSTTAPITGGGDLSADRTIAISAATSGAAGSMSAADKTKLDAVSGTNTGDQTSIVGITGSLAEFNTALTGADFASGGGTATGTNTGDQTITLTGDVTGSGTSSFAATIAAASVTFAKMQNAAANSKLLGSGAAGSGASYVELTVGSGLTMTGTTLSATGSYTDEQAQDAIGAMIDSSLAYVDATPLLQRAALTGDVTASAGSNATTIAAAAVTLAKMADMATTSVIYRKTAGTGVPEVNTLATLKTDLGLTGTNSGDQTITLTGDVTGTGTGSFATTVTARSKRTVFTGSGTWTKDSKSVVVHVEVYGGGGGAGGGALTASGTASSGGGGGGGASYTEDWFAAGTLGGTETVTIGGGGAGGIGVSVAGNGNNGSSGGASTFGAWVKAYGGGSGARGGSAVASGGGGGGGFGGAGGSASAGTAGGAGSMGGISGGAGVGANNNGVKGGGGGGNGGNNGNVGTGNSGYAYMGGAGGGAGGGVSTTPAAFGGGIGGFVVPTATSGAAGGTADNVGTSGGTQIDYSGGGGGGGAGSSITGNGKVGGAGQQPGGGGGGGSSCIGAFTSGTGGAGGAGLIVVTEFF